MPDVLPVAELVEKIVRALVDRPDDVRVNVVRGSQATILEVTVAPEDVAKVIGKKGVHADAIRRIVSAIAGREKHRYQFEILDPEGRR